MKENNIQDKTQLLKEDLAIDEWLELIKEDKNLNGAYISIAQYTYLIEKENQELKKQLDDTKDYINKLQATKDKLDKWDYENALQQKEFIKYLEEPIKIIKQGNPTNITEYTSAKLDTLETILQKYKEIIGVSDENN